MLTRRAFLQSTPAGAALGAVAFRDDSRARALAANEAIQDHTPSAAAADEAYWREIQQAFTLDRTIINLNNGGVCPSPRVARPDPATADREPRARR